MLVNYSNIILQAAKAACTLRHPQALISYRSKVSMLPGIFLAESEQFLVVEAPFLCPLLFLNYIINMKKNP